MKNAIFYLGFGLLCTHELDAVANHEWKILPLTSWLPIEYGEIVFITIHIPLFSILVAMISSRNEVIRGKSRFWISVFLTLHGVLHIAFMTQENYKFESVLSNLLIFGAAVCGVIYLTMSQSNVNKST